MFFWDDFERIVFCLFRGKGHSFQFTSKKPFFFSILPKILTFPEKLRCFKITSKNRLLPISSKYQHFQEVDFFADHFDNVVFFPHISVILTFLEKGSNFEITLINSFFVHISEYINISRKRAIFEITLTKLVFWPYLLNY